MKTILILLLSCLPLFGATTYPVLTDNANRTFIGGATNMALLSGTNVFTGTNTFTAAKFFPANNVGLRFLWGSTNITLGQLAISASLLTNNGDFNKGTYVATATIPPLLGSNSTLVLYSTQYRTNVSATVGNLGIYIGTNTNFVGYFAAFQGGSIGNGQNLNLGLLQCYGSHTSQIQGPSIANSATIYGPSNFCDFSVTNTLYFNGWTVTGNTNPFINIRIYEAYSP